MTRYEPCDPNGGYFGMYERPEGMFIEFDDAAPLIKALEYIAGYAQMSNEPVLEDIAVAALEKAGLPYKHNPDAVIP